MNELIIKNVINQPHLQQIMTSFMKQVFIRGYIVAIVVACLPATEEWESAWIEAHNYALTP